MRTLLLALLFLAACRQIVGVEDVALDTDGDDDILEAGASSSSSGTVDDGGGDGSPILTGDAAACIGQTNCRRCCKQEFPKLAEFQDEQRGCLCQQCATECASSAWYCSGGQTPDAECQRCIDDKIAENACSAGCGADCEIGRACLQACPAPPQ